MKGGVATPKRQIPSPPVSASGIAAVGRKDWIPNEYTWICSVHLVSGKRAKTPNPGADPGILKGGGHH